MITVIELLSYPLFHNFKLLSNDSGLYNNVLGTGIFEWETKEDINATFEVGEFVMTTLSSAKEDIRIAEEGFKALLQKKVSAIAVKSVYFSELPEELVRLSNLYRVPLFLFSDTYFDDIIYTIKSILISNDHNATLVKKVALLLESKEPETDLLTLSTEINPFFYDHFICAFCSPKVRNKECSLEEKTLYLDQFYESYLKMFKKNNPAHKSIYSLIKMNSGILLIFTYDNPDPSTLHKALFRAVLFGT